MKVLSNSKSCRFQFLCEILVRRIERHDAILQCFELYDIIINYLDEFGNSHKETMLTISKANTFT
jgi:hypothetical protein